MYVPVYSHQSTRIIGGDNAQVGRHPYMVSLLNEDEEHTCGGSLVAADVVITAAHCRYVLNAALVRTVTHPRNALIS